ncbi:Methylglyoxal synthase [compost metagenome]
MQLTTRTMPQKKRIALVAHDPCKPDLLNWAIANQTALEGHTIYATGTTGNLLLAHTRLPVLALMSGSIGGDQQLGYLIASGQIDVLVFFWDPLSAVPHHSDVKALMRLATAWNIPIASNACSANFLIHSSLFEQTFDITVPDGDAFLSSRVSHVTQNGVHTQHLL